MFTWVYAVSELTRRKGRAVATALGLAVGVGLVAAVGALSAGLSDAQEEVLAPLRSIGTDISVTRPLEVQGGEFEPGRGGGNLTEDERAQLEEENGAARLDFGDLGDPGEEFSVDTFAAFGQLSFPQSEAATVADVEGVAQVAPSLTLTWIHVEGTVPEQTTQEPQGGQGPPGAAGGPPQIGAARASSPRRSRASTGPRRTWPS